MADRYPLVNDMQTFKIPPSAAPSMLVHMEFPMPIIETILSLKCNTHTKNDTIVFFSLKKTEMKRVVHVQVSDF